jgi:uncharacterized protein YkwD
LRHASVVLVLALLALCGVPAVAAATTPEERMIERINEVRTGAAGLAPLRAAPALERSAGSFARYLVGHETLEHRPAVSTGRSYSHAGEALAMHFSLQAKVGPTLRTWLASPTHRELVLTSSMNLVGIGHSSGRLRGKPRTVWVIQVARR